MSLKFQSPDESGHENEDKVDEIQSRSQKKNKDTQIKKGNSRGSGRLMALDAVRGLAVIGMFIQHFAEKQWNGNIVSGNTTLLFVLCGGISYSIMAQRMKERGTDDSSFRAKMLARAVFVDVIGYLLIMLNTPYGIILPAYAAMFVLGLILVGRSTRTLATTAVSLTLLAPPLMILGQSAFLGSFLLADIAGGPMSSIALAPAFVAGMTIGRLDLTRKRVSLSLAFGGLVMVVIIKSLASKVLPELGRSFETWLVSVQGVAAQPDQYAIWPLNVESPMWHMLLWTTPHSASTFQTMAGLGVALLVLGFAFLIPQKLNVLLRPFAAVGRVALTMYAIQFVFVWILSLSGINYSYGEMPFGDLLVLIVTLILGWLISRLGTGPLESLMRYFDRLFSASPPKTNVS
ncbi:DUF418 domain-containing protein [Paenibacillus sp. FSL K6-1318]|uniref:DUF418 domain-containing protein n=1 Tax=Paenibacillus sp. FSL K6-1318 TaxID=2975291 RepID=UPI0030EB7F7B